MLYVTNRYGFAPSDDRLFFLGYHRFSVREMEIHLLEEERRVTVGTRIFLRGR